MKIEFSPIGIVHTPFKTVNNMPIQPTADKDSEGWIEIFDEYVKPYVPSFEDTKNIHIEWFSAKEDKILGKVSGGRFNGSLPIRK